MEERLRTLQTDDDAGRTATQPEAGPPVTEDEFGLARRANVGDGGEIEQTLARTATEEGIADAIPGIGEILGAGIAIFGGIEAAVEGADKPRPPPKLWDSQL